MTTEHPMQPSPRSEYRQHASPQERRPPPRPCTRLEARLLERLRAERGAAFDIYLAHVWNGIEAIPDMEADFDNLHWASYERPEHFVDDFIDNLGWAAARDNMLREWVIPKDVLVFDRHAFLEHLRGDFDFYERDGETHVFVK